MLPKEQFHYETQEDLVMALMNEGWTREYAERLIASRTEEAYIQNMARQEELCQKPL